MGYRAKDAEEVYRHLLRLDDKSERRLSDGFSWSILFLNDSSQISQDFFARYGLELCYCTADRVRFVFFSELGGGEITRIITASHGDSGHGFLYNLIKATLHRLAGSKRYNSERHGWDTFRPAILEPLRSREEIEQYLRRDSTLAVPGSGEAYRLAQRLGIGRYMPCFLIFGDIGEQGAYLLPCTDKVEEIFSILKNLIDSFYEMNRDQLAYWQSVEEKITGLCASERSSLNAVDQWIRTRNQDWSLLLRISSHLHAIVCSSNPTEKLKVLVDDWQVPYQLRQKVSECLKVVNNAARTSQIGRMVLENIQRLEKEENNDEAIVEILNRLRSAPNDFSTELLNFIKQTSRLYKPPRESITLEESLKRWWLDRECRPFYLNQYRKFRQSWVSYSYASYGTNAKGYAPAIIRNEYDCFIAAFHSQPFNLESGCAAEAVIEELKRHLEVEDHDLNWKKAMSRFRNALEKLFERLKMKSPFWLSELVIGSELPVTWGQLVPREDALQLIQKSGTFDAASNIVGFVSERISNWADILLKMDINLRDKKKAAIAKLVEKLNFASKSAATVETSAHIEIQKAILLLEGERNHLRHQVNQNARHATKTEYPGKHFGENAYHEMFELLEKYDGAIRSLKYPFESSEALMKVSLKGSIASIIGYEANNGRMRAKLRASKELTTMLARVNLSIAEWPSMQEQAASISSFGKFFSVLEGILTAERVNALASITALGEQLREVPAVETIVAILELLTGQELSALERTLNDGKKGLPPSQVRSKKEIHESILLSLGYLPMYSLNLINRANVLLTGNNKSMKEKIEDGIFDVFMAHNSKDKSTILSLAIKLKQLNVRAWVDIEEVPPGQWFQDVIQAAARTAKTAAIFIGTHGLGKWQALELRTVISQCVEHGVPVIPVLLPGVDQVPDELLFLRELNYVKFTRDIDEEEPLERLVWGVTGKKPTF